MMLFLSLFAIFAAALFLEATVIPWTFGVFFPFSHWTAIAAFSLLSLPAALFFLIFSGAFFWAAFPAFGIVRFSALMGAFFGILLIRRIFDDEELAGRMIAFAAGALLAWIFESFAAWFFVPRAAMIFSGREALISGFFVLAASSGFLFWSFLRTSKKIRK